MSKKNNKKQELPKKEYKNPAETKWGKALIWIIIFGMAGILLISTIWIIIDAIAA